MYRRARQYCDGKLFKQFPTLQSFADASEEEIAEAIKTCGLFRTKARDLKACAMMLIANYGGRVPDTMEELLKLPGVGRKTANLILDIFGKPAIVCDTHCIRCPTGWASSRTRRTRSRSKTP